MADGNNEVHHGGVAGTAPASGRLASIDVFRGVTIAAMLLVNNPGNWGHIYAPLRHAAWHGCTPTDLIFPFFLFIVGVSMAFSRRLGAGAWPIARRAMVLIGLGLLLNLASIVDVPRGEVIWDRLRLPGVLQRIGLVYAAAAVIVLGLRVRWQAVLSMAALGAYAAMLEVGPRWMGMAAGGDALSPGENIVGRIDRAVLTPARMFMGGPTDPEGLLSTLPAVVSSLAGYWAGLWVRRSGAAARGMVVLGAAGLAGIAVGYALSLWHPLNKPLWTSTYTVYTAGWAAVVLAVCVMLVDGVGERWRVGLRVVWRPLETMGINAILAFVGSGLLARILGQIPMEDGSRLPGWLFGRAVGAGLSPVNASLAYALATLAVWWVVMEWCRRRGWVLRV